MWPGLQDTLLMLKLLARFCDCVEQMTGKRPNLFWFLCWKYFAPAVMFVSIKTLYPKNRQGSEIKG
jgi:hypothetical protein